VRGFRGSAWGALLERTTCRSRECMTGSFTDVSRFKWIVPVMVLPRSHLSGKTLRFLKSCDIEWKSEDDREGAPSARRSIDACHAITPSELKLENRL